MKNEQQWQPTNLIYNEAVSKWVPNYEYIAPWSQYVTKLESEAYIPILERISRGDLLDVGAGTVPYYQVYRDKVDSVTTIDWDESSHDISHIDVLHNLNQGLPFDDDSFDTVLIADALEHISNSDRLISDVSRVLRENGHLILFVPFMYGLHEEPYDYHRYTKHALIDLLERNSLTIDSLTAYGGGPDVAIDLLEKMTYETRFAKIIHNIASKAVTSTVFYENLREKYKERFPIGYTLIALKPSLEDINRTEDK